MFLSALGWGRNFIATVECRIFDSRSDATNIVSIRCTLWIEEG